MRIKLSIKVANFFEVCIDNLLKMIYNVKRLLCILLKKRNLAVFWALACLVLPMLVSFAPSNGLEPQILGLSLGAEIGDDGEMITITLQNPQKADLAGLAVELHYDMSFVKLMAVERGGGLHETVGFSYVDCGDRVKMIVDSCYNTDPEEIAVLRFSVRKDSAGGLAAFELSGAFGVAACRIVNGRTVAAELDVENRVILPVSPAASAGGRGLPNISAVTAEGTEIFLSGALSYWCFAAGFEVSLTDLSDCTRNSYLLVGVLPLSAGRDNSFTQRVSLPTCGEYYLSVRPIAFDRCGEICGECAIFWVRGGRLEPCDGEDVICVKN